MTLAERFAGEMGRLLGPDFPTDIVLAVSGGGDSMAMLALTHDWARVFGVKLWVVTVDHGLREESAEEAVMVAAECAALGHRHETLHWYWDGQGNLQDAARNARLELIDAWRGDINHVLMAHTQDDVAETFLLRLARGSGVDGLSAMADRRLVRGATGSFLVIRPLLRETRTDLRHHIDTLKVPYANDPSNADPRFDRVKARKALDALGIDAQTLTQTAHRMARAAGALRARAAEIARDATRVETVNTGHSGNLLIDRDVFAETERDTQMRILSAALQWVASAPYRPRASALEALLDRVLAGGGGTLHGTQVDVGTKDIRVAREFAAVRDLSSSVGEVWDTRWAISAPDLSRCQVRALGLDGWKQVSDKPVTGLPQHALLAYPSIFDGTSLIACAALGFGPAYVARFAPPAGQFITFLVSR